ncbi:MAG: hypothetical protein EOO13_09795 [Chitinophagaceae bacterium]|nr:MAG: hypothetical protein EOO13_09795 [Chitinophagaceae bacterium]
MSLAKWNPNEETQTERFQKHYADEEKYPLSAKEKEIFERWRAVYALMLKGRTDNVIYSIIKKEFKVSEGTVRNDINGVQNFFGSLEESHHAFRKSQYRQFLFEGRLRAIARNNDAVTLRYELALMKLDGLDKKNDETIDFTKFEQHTYEMNVYLQGEGKAQIINLEKPETIPLELRESVMAAITPKKMSADEFMARLKEETEDVEAAEEL